MIRSKKNRIIPGREVQDLSDFVNNLTTGKPFIVKNFKDSRILDTNTATLGNIADTLATLINELRTKGIIPQ